MLRILSPQLFAKSAGKLAREEGESRPLQECAGGYTTEDCALPAEQPEENGKMKYSSTSYRALEADILVLEEEQAQKLLEFLDGQQIALEPAEGGSYLSIEGRREVLLPFFEQSDIAVDLGQYRALFLTGV